MTKLISIKLYSKNNARTGKYVYGGIASDGEKYYYARIAIQSKPIRLKDVKSFEVGRIIEPKFYEANGIK